MPRRCDQVDPPGVDLDGEEDVEPAQPHGFDLEEVGGEDPSRMSVQELLRVGPDRRGAGPSRRRRRSVRIAVAEILMPS